MDSKATKNATAWLAVDAIDMLWLIPYSEALHLDTFTPDNTSSLCCGEQSWQQHIYPVLAWDKSIRLTNAPDERCQSALLLQGPGFRFALACRRVLRLEAPVFYRLPQCMQGRRQFFTDIAVLKNRAMCKVNAELLAQQLPEEITQSNPINRVRGGQG